MLQPLADRVLVEMDDSLPNQAGLILRADVSKWREADDQIGNRGVVVAVGPGKRHPKTHEPMPMSLKAGDIVRFSELEFPEHKENGKRYALISEMDVTFVEEAA